MRHPSIRFRLMLGTGVVVACLLVVANITIYRTLERTLWKEVDHQLSQSASLLGKSVELEVDHLDYEWQEAMKNPGVPDITGIFQFWDLETGKTTKSPDLAGDELPQFHGTLNKPTYRNITFRNGSKARAVGLLHLPFIDQESIDKAAVMGVPLDRAARPQVLVCARETETLDKRLDRLRDHLIWATVGTLVAIWGSILLISLWCLRPLRELNDNLLSLSEEDSRTVLEIPKDLPAELTGVARTIHTTLDHLEKSRTREKQFALNAAHELRTPLAGILATLEQAVYRPRSPQELSARIHHAIDISISMRTTLESLMHMARLRGGLERSSPSHIEPASLIRTLYAGKEDQATARNLTVQLKIPAEMKILHTDPGLFTTLISNLIDNAIAHSPEGDLVEFEALETPEYFVFATRNAANGIEPDALDNLFEPFQRSHSLPDDTGNHAGLGLSLSREAARIMGGTLKAAIDPEGIISFTSTIPHRGGL